MLNEHAVNSSIYYETETNRTSAGWRGRSCGISIMSMNFPVARCDFEIFQPEGEEEMMKIFYSNF